MLKTYINDTLKMVNDAIYTMPVKFTYTFMPFTDFTVPIAYAGFHIDKGCVSFVLIINIL